MDTTTRTASKFATIRDGVIANVTDATPEHTLLPNQIELSNEEYYLLKYFRNLDEVKKAITSLEAKVNLIKSGDENAPGG